MKKIKTIFIISVISFLLSISKSYSKSYGEGELKLTDNMIKYFHQYLKGKGNKRPMMFSIAVDGSYATYWYCPVVGQCSGDNPEQYNKLCEIDGGIECKVFARGRYIKWKNGINVGKGKASKIKSNQSFSDLKARLAELGFVGDLSSSNSTISKKIEKKETKKVVKKYELKGERSIALSWDGYENLIAGTVKFDETDYKGTLYLPLPNNDGTCDGSYFLQEGGKGTWQIACTNNMGAAGTLKWTEKGGVTGTGRDYNDKKVKFTVSNKS